MFKNLPPSSFSVLAVRQSSCCRAVPLASLKSQVFLHPPSFTFVLQACLSTAMVNKKLFVHIVDIIETGPFRVKVLILALEVKFFLQFVARVDVPTANSKLGAMRRRITPRPRLWRKLYVPGNLDSILKQSVILQVRQIFGTSLFVKTYDRKNEEGHSSTSIFSRNDNAQ